MWGLLQVPIGFGVAGRLLRMQKRIDRAELDREYWRRLEGEARSIGALMTDPQQKRVMHAIAEAYRRLAERAELRKT
jgi:hypothetical protein